MLLTAISKQKKHTIAATHHASDSPQARIISGQGQDRKFPRTTALMSRDSVCWEGCVRLNMNDVSSTCTCHKNFVSRFILRTDKHTGGTILLSLVVRSSAMLLSGVSIRLESTGLEPLRF